MIFLSRFMILDQPFLAWYKKKYLLSGINRSTTCPTARFAKAQRGEQTGWNQPLAQLSIIFGEMLKLNI